MASLIWYYIFVFLIFVQALLMAQKKSTTILFICFFELLFIMGYREYYGDILIYLNVFHEIKRTYWMSIFNWASHMEVGYLFFNKLLSYFVDSSRAFTLCTSAIILGGFFVFIKKFSTNYFLSIMIFVTFLFPSVLSYGRQDLIATLTTVIGTSFIIKRQFFRFLICIIIAMTFHTSAIWMLGIYFLYGKRFKLRYIFLGIIGAVIVMTFFSPIINNVFSVLGRYSDYTGTRILMDLKTASIVKTLIYGSIALFIFFTYYSRPLLLRKQERYIKTDFLLFVTLLIFLLFVVSIQATILERLNIYLCYYLLIILPMCLQCYKNILRSFIFCIIIGFFLSYNTTVSLLRPGWLASFSQYRFCIEEIISEE